MDSAEDPFTQRMLHRASIRRQRDAKALDLSTDDLKRKLSILQAIDDRPTRTTGADSGDTLTRSQISRSDTQISKGIDLPIYRFRSQFGRSFLQRPCSATLSQNLQENSKETKGHSINDRPKNLNNMDTNMGSTYSRAKEVSNVETQYCESNETKRLNHIDSNTASSTSGSDEDPIYPTICKPDKSQFTENRATASEIYDDGRRRPDLVVTNDLSKPTPSEDTNNNGTPSEGRLKESGSSNDTTSTSKDTENYKSTSHNHSKVTFNVTKNDHAKVKSPALKSYKNSMNSTQEDIDVTQTSKTTSLNAIQTSTKYLLSSPTYIEGFELGNVKWRGPLYNAACYSSKKEYYDYHNDLTDFLSTSSPDKSHVESQLHEITVPKLFNVEHKEIQAPQKMRVQWKMIDMVPDMVAYSESVSIDNKNWTETSSTSISSRNRVSGFSRDKLYLPLNCRNYLDSQESVQDPSWKYKLSVDNASTQNADSPTTPLSAAIRDLDAEIQQLEFRPNLFTPENMIDFSFPQRIYPNLSKIKFSPTGFSPKKLNLSPCSPENNLEPPFAIHNSEAKVNVWSRESDGTNASHFQDSTSQFVDGSRGNQVTATPAKHRSESHDGKPLTPQNDGKFVSPKSRNKEDSPGGLEKVPEDNSVNIEEKVSSNEENFMYSESKSSNASNFLSPVQSSEADTKSDYFKSNASSGFPETTSTTSAITIENSGAKPSRFLKNNSVATVLTFDTPKSGKPKPNLESTRKSSNLDLSKKTASPSQIDSTISTITMPNTPKTPENLQNLQTSITERNLDATIPYEVERFLEEALGDELYNTTVTYAPSEAQDKSFSQYNVSELISGDRTPIQRKIRVVKAPMSEPPPQHASTFNRAMTIYRSFTQRIKKKFRPGLKSLPKAPSTSLVATVNGSEDEKIQALLQEANIQQTIIYQACKALNICRSMKEFLASPEQVELERLLLVAGMRKTAVLEEIKRLNYENNNDLFCEKGEVTVKDFSLALKEDVLNYERHTSDFVQWFVLVVSHGPTIWATHAISCPINSPRIHLPGTVSITNLSPDFKITIQIYSLKLKRVTFNHDEKYHLNKNEKNTACPSPKRLLKRSDKSNSPKKQIEFTTLRNTSFTHSGAVDLQLHDLTMLAPWPLTSIPTESVLKGTIDLTLSCKLHLSVYHAGFLNHGDEAGGYAVWNRRWCVLQGHTLMFWNYPRDQENKEPLATIDLMNSTSDQVAAVDRSLCAKPRTLMIETARRRSISDRDSMVLECRPAYTIVRNLLSYDTAHDITEWISKLNYVISALREWNVTTRRPQVQVSDL